MRVHAPPTRSPLARRGVAGGRAPAIGNRALARLAASSPALPAGRGLSAGAAARFFTSPPNVDTPARAVLEDDVELTTPTTPSGTAVPQPAIDATTRQEPMALRISGSGAIEGPFGIGQYWPVTNYWGADSTLGQFDEPLAGSTDQRMIGHKFQVVGQFSSSCVESGTGLVAFQQEARLTNTKGGAAGAWFDDMQYTDAGGGVHHWDPNAESGTTGAGPGVRRTVAADTYAYTDPPAISYGPSTNAYRKLDFRIHFRAPSGGRELTREMTQEIEVKDGVPTVLQAPSA